MTDKTDSKEREALRTIAEWPITKAGQFDAMDAVNMAQIAREALASIAANAGSGPTKYVNELLRTALLELMKAEDRAENLSFAADKFARDSARFAMNDAMERARKAIAYVPENPQHDSDCSLHNEPAFPAGPCDCSVSATHPSPPEGMVGGWKQLIEAPNNEIVLVAAEFDGPGDWRIKCGYLDGQTAKWRVFGASWEPTHWMPLPPPPTSSADSRKGE